MPVDPIDYKTIYNSVVNKSPMQTVANGCQINS